MPAGLEDPQALLPQVDAVGDAGAVPCAAHEPELVRGVSADGVDGLVGECREEPEGGAVPEGDGGVGVVGGGHRRVRWRLARSPHATRTPATARAPTMTPRPARTTRTATSRGVAGAVSPPARGSRGARRLRRGPGLSLRCRGGARLPRTARSLTGQ